MDNCTNRYNQIYSIYNKKKLPFLEYLSGGILTNFNPSIVNPSEKKSRNGFSLLVDKRESKEYGEIEKPLSARPNNYPTFSFAEEESC